ncbi:MAG: transglutaminase-like domain-containing protein [Candidatus Thermoplasmatota archaeon]
MAYCPIHKIDGTYPYNQFLRPQEVLEIAAKIRKECTSGYTEIMRRIANFVINNVNYRRDIERWGHPDRWQFPSETMRYHAGDCEDMSFLVASILLAIGFPKKMVRVVLGTYKGEGHAWVEVIMDASCYLIESTSSKVTYYPLCTEQRAKGYTACTYVYLHGCSQAEHL